VFSRELIPVCPRWRREDRRVLAISRIVVNFHQDTRADAFTDHVLELRRRLCYLFHLNLLRLRSGSDRNGQDHGFERDCKEHRTGASGHSEMALRLGISIKGLAK
jgi:hypothetical protein